MDGQGYPDGLSGDAVPFLSRIISLADSYEAMTSSCSHREGCPHSAGRGRLAVGPGTYRDLA